MSSNQIIDGEANANLNVKFKNIGCLNIDCDTINGVTLDNVCIVNQAPPPATAGAIPKFAAGVAATEISESLISIDENNDLNLNNFSILNCNEANINNLKISDGSEFKNVSGLSKILKNNTSNLTFKNTETTADKGFKVLGVPFYANDMYGAANISTPSETNFKNYRLRIATHKDESFILVAHDGSGGEVPLFNFINNNFSPRFSINVNNYNLSQPHINNNGLMGIAFDNNTTNMTLCNNTQEKIKIGTTTTTYTNTNHNFYGAVTAFNSFIIGGQMSCGYLNVTDTSWARWGFHANLSATTGYDLTNIINITVPTENTFVKLNNTFVIGVPQTLTTEAGSNGGLNPATGDCTINANGYYLITVNITYRKVTSTGSRLVSWGVGFNGNPPALASRIISSASVNVDDWNSVSASNVVQLTIFNTYALWVSVIDLGGAVSQNIYVGDLSSSIFKVG